MKLEAGDIIQVDGGNAIVTQVKGDRALIAAIGDLGGRSVHALKNGVELEITRNRLVERRGETGLAEFLAERNSNAKHERKGQIKTEPGDRLCYEGAICIVASVTGSKCEIAHPDGRMFTDDRWLNEFFFRDCSCHKLMRLTAEQREANLKGWKVAVRPETNKAAEKTINKDQQIRIQEKKMKNNKQENSNEADAKVESKVSCAGLGEMITSEVEKSDSKEEIMIAVKAAYPKVSESYISKIVMKKLEKKAAK